MSSNSCSQWIKLEKELDDLCGNTQTPKQVEELLAGDLQSEISKLQGDVPDALIASIPGALNAARETGIPFKVDRLWRVRVPATVVLPFERFLAARRNRIEKSTNDTPEQNKTERVCITDARLFEFLARFDELVHRTEQGEGSDSLRNESDKRTENEVANRLRKIIHSWGTQSFLFMPLLLLVGLSVLFA